MPSGPLGLFAPRLGLDATPVNSSPAWVHLSNKQMQVQQTNASSTNSNKSSTVVVIGIILRERRQSAQHLSGADRIP